MDIILFAIVIGLSFVYFGGIQYIRQKKFIQQENNAGKKLQIANYAKTWTMVNAAMAVSCIVFGILYHQDTTSVAIAIALTGSFLGNIISSQIKRQLYYNNKGFIMNDTYIRYQSIKEVVTKQRIIPVYEIVTFNGTRYKTIKQSADLIVEMKKQAKGK